MITKICCISVGTAVTNQPDTSGQDGTFKLYLSRKTLEYFKKLKEIDQSI